MAADEDSASKAGGKSETGKPARRSRQPVTIDLAASAVERSDPVEPKAESEAQASAAEPAVENPGEARPKQGGREAGAPSERSSPRVGTQAGPMNNWVALFVAGLVGGLIVLLFGYGLGGIGGGGGREALEANAVAQKRLGDSVAGLDKRVAAIEGRPVPADPSASIGSLTTRLGAVESAVTATSNRLDKAETAIAAIPPQSAQPGQNLAQTSRVLDDLLQRVDRLEETASVPPIVSDRISALETSTAVLSGRLDALADQIQALSAKPAAAEDSEKAARAVAIGTLRQAAERGGNFAADLAMIEALDIAPADVAALKPLAEKGAPAKAQLAAEFPAISDAILAAAARSTESGGIVDRLIAHARGLVTVRPVGPIAGDTPEAIVSRMQAAVDKSDLAAALKEREGLPETGRSASAAWAERAADRVAIDRLVGKLVVALGAPRPAE